MARTYKKLIKPKNSELALKWFDLKNYRPVVKFNARQWAQQIAKRVFIQSALNSPDETSANPLAINIQKLLDEPLSQFDYGYDNRPGVVLPPKSLLPVQMDEVVTMEGSGAGSKIAKQINTILPLRFKDIDRLKKLEIDYPAAVEMGVDHWSQQNLELGLIARGHVIVDLDARDKDIIVDFKRWLTSIREETKLNPPKLHSQNLEDQFFDWHQDALLPYFDLTLWGVYNQTPLSELELLRLLYPIEFADNVICDAFLVDKRSRLKTFKKRIPAIFSLSNVTALLTGS
jgi:hypothetical protein